MPETLDDIRELRDTWEATLPHDEYRRRMSTKVDEMAIGAPGRAELLVWLASDLGDVDDAERGLEFARAAVADGGPTTIDARVAVVGALLKLERGEEADEMVRELLRAASREDVTVGLHPALGEVLEDASRLREAQRAYTVGLRELDPEVDSPEDDSMDDIFCLGGRYRIRRQLGLGRDRYDTYFEDAYVDAAEDLREQNRPPSTS